MKAKVVGIHSGSNFTDGKRRVTLEFTDCDSLYRQIRFPQEMLGTAVELDEEITVVLKLAGMSVVAA